MDLVKEGQYTSATPSVEKTSAKKEVADTAEGKSGW